MLRHWPRCCRAATPGSTAASSASLRPTPSMAQALSLNSCTFPDGLDRNTQMPRLQHLDLAWSQHPECHKLLKAAGPSVTHLNLRVRSLTIRGSGMVKLQGARSASHVWCLYLSYHFEDILQALICTVGGKFQATTHLIAAGTSTYQEDAVSMPFQCPQGC